MKTTSKAGKADIDVEVRADDDDWTGLTDPKERRKRQNRLHARAWRKRKATQGVEPTTQPTTTPSTRLASTKTHNGPAPTSLTWTPSSSSTPSSTSPSHPKLIPPLIPYLHSSSPTSVPSVITFPLSPDHHLLTLMQYNVLRATMTNLSLLSLLYLLPVECSAARSLIGLLPRPSSVPPTFLPTPLQLTVKHDYWIDAMPVPKMRDNLILYRDRYDPDELCVDLCGGLYDGFDEIELRGILVWGDPWREDGWEVTEGFARRWGFLLGGCDGLVEATNRYRAARGEGMLVVEV